MGIKLERYDPQKHDKKVLAELIFKSDEEMNALVYGNNATEVIKILLDMPESYFLPEYTRCAMLDNELVGVIVRFPVSQRKEADKNAGQGFIKAMGFFGFIRKMALYMKMQKMLGGVLDDDGMYIHTLCVDGRFRGKGIGTEMLQAIAEENSKMYLYVNTKNEGAIRFYKKNGFYEKFHGKLKYKGQVLGEYLMERK